MSDWRVTAEILFKTNGSSVLRRLLDRVKRVTVSMDRAQASVDKFSASIESMTAACERAASAMGGMAAAADTNAAASDRAASSASRAASGYTRTAEAAARATKAVAALSAAYARAVLPPAPRQFSLGPGSSGGGMVPFVFGGGQRSLPPGFQPPAVPGDDGSDYSYRGQRALPAGSSVPAIPPSGYTWSSGSGAPGGGGGGGGGRVPGVVPIPPSVIGAATHGLSVAAEVAAGMIGDAVYEAQKVQAINQSTANITNATPKQMADLNKLELSVGGQNAMAKAQVADMFRDISRQTQGTMTFEDQESLLKTVAKEYTVLHAARGFTVQQTTDAVIKLVHLMRAFSPKQFPQLSDTILRMGELSPDDLAKAATQFTYMSPVLNSLRVPIPDQAALFVSLSRLGFGKGKGGTNVADLLNAALGPLEQTQHAQAGKALLLGPKGMNILDDKGRSRYFVDNKPADLFGNGTPGDSGFFGALYSYRQRVGANEFTKEVKSAFGAQGGRIATMYADPTVYKQLQIVRGLIEDKNSSLGLENQAKNIMGTARMKSKQIGANYQSASAVLGDAFLPALNKLTVATSAAIAKGAQWIIDHPDKMKRFGDELESSVEGAILWLASHKRDLRDAADAMEYMMHVARLMSPIVRGLGDGVFLLTGAFEGALKPIKLVTDGIENMFKWYAGFSGSQTDNVKLTPAQRKEIEDAGKRNPLDRTIADFQSLMTWEKNTWAWIHSHGGSPVPSALVPTPPSTQTQRTPGVVSVPPRQNAPLHAQSMDHRERVRERGQPQVVHHHAHTHGDVHIRIDGSKNPEQTARAVKLVLDFERQINNPMHSLMTGIAHPNLPAPLTTPLGIA